MRTMIFATLLIVGAAFAAEPNTPAAQPTTQPSGPRSPGAKAVKRWLDQQREVQVDPNVAAAKQQIESAWRKCESVSADIEIKATYQWSNSVTEKHSRGRLEVLQNDGGEIFVRLEQNERLAREADGEREEKRRQTTNVITPNAHWVVIERDANAVARVTGPPPLNPAKPDDMMRRLDKIGGVQVLPEEKVAGLDCIVLQAERELPPGRKVRAGRPSRMVQYWSKDYGVMIRSVTYDQHGTLVNSEALTNIKFNQPIPMERFHLEPPPGVEWNDEREAAPLPPNAS